MRLSAYVLDSTILELLGHGNEEDVKNIVSMAIMSHKNCGLDYSSMNQMEHSHVKKLVLANEIDVSDQSEEECLHQ